MREREILEELKNEEMRLWEKDFQLQLNAKIKLWNLQVKDQNFKKNMHANKENGDTGPPASKYDNHHNNNKSNVITRNPSKINTFTCNGNATNNQGKNNPT